MALVAAISATLAWAGAARAQSGSGGAVGTGTLAETDMFLSVQKVEKTNLNQRDQARFLNRASCKCEKDVWLRAVVLPTAAGKAATISAIANVTAMFGYECSNSTLRPACQLLASVPISEFRLSGITAKTTVKELAGHRIASGIVAGTGGASGTGGTGDAGGTGGTASGGASGSGGATGTGGFTGTGGAPGTADVCDMGAFTQTFWIFIGTSGDGGNDIATAKLPLLMDVEPPRAPVMEEPGPVHQALMVKWAGLSTAEAADLLGYQLICSRGDSTQVFKTDTYSPQFDDLCTGKDTPQTEPWPNEVGSTPVRAFACSDILPSSTSSYRLKILENKVQYRVAVAAVDKQGNASPLTPKYGVPVLTKDFYYEYRHNDPQGSAEGGFCAIPHGAPVGLGAAGGLGLMLGVGLAVRAMARRRSRRQP